MFNAPHVEIVAAELDSILIASGYARIENSKPYLLHEKHAYLGFMYVDPAHRGKSVNKKIRLSEKMGGLQKNTELRLEVYVDSITAITAYERLGLSNILWKCE